MKKSSVSRSIREATSHRASLDEGAATEFYFCAQSFHRAAKSALAALASNPARQDWDIWPVIFLYRQALEFHLKAIVVGPGVHYLPSKPDNAWAYRTRSLRRLQDDGLHDPE